MSKKKRCRDCKLFDKALYAGRINNLPVYHCLPIQKALAEATGDTPFNYRNFTIDAMTYACDLFNSREED